MKQIICFLIIIPLVSNSQIADSKNKYINNGIEFIQGVSWQEVLKKASSEGKSIFVDCYTTWCAPCKKMEKEVYSDSEVGQLFNSNFICYKLQMDSSKNDDDVVKSSYSDALYFKGAYKVFTFPTALFFSSDGMLLNRQEGLMQVSEFVKLGKDVLDPRKNYYKLLENYNNGKRNLDEMRLISKTALLLLKDTVTAQNVANTYMKLLPKKESLTKDNIEFLDLFTRSSEGIGFKLFYQNTESIDKIMDDKMYAQSLIRSIIFKEMVLPDIKKARAMGNEPNWSKLEYNIRNKYNRFYSDLVITAIKLDWYRLQKKWKDYSKTVVKYVDNYVVPVNKQGHWPAFSLNNFAWDIFKYSNEKSELERALIWSGKAVMMDPNPNWMDTYANILYKLGRTELAFKWEETANKLAPGDTDIKTALKSMQEGKPTWPTVK
jgi:thioredoxin-related protein